VPRFIDITAIFTKWY